MSMSILSKKSFFILFIGCASVACTQDQPTEESTTPANTPEATTIRTNSSTGTEGDDEIPANFKIMSDPPSKSGFVKNPGTTHEKIAARFVKRMQQAIDLTEAQQIQILAITKTYSESSIKGKAGQANRQEIKKRSYVEVFTDEQRSAIDNLGVNWGTK